MTVELAQLAVVFGVAAVLGLLARHLKQPLILAYLATGFVIAWLGFFDFGDREAFRLLSDLGVMFLLFLIGLEINYAAVRHVGRPALAVGIGQVVLTFLLGFFIVQSFGYELLEASYISIALTFSSTVIVVKLLSEKRDLGSLYGRISVGMLLVQDAVAILLLVFLAGIGEDGGATLWWRLPATVVLGLALFSVTLVGGRRMLPRLFDRVARSQELLFLLSAAWVFVVVAAVRLVGFSIEIGGFLAGLALANSSEHFQIASRIRPLRDFFLAIFFVILGSSAAFADFSGLFWPAVLLSLFVVIGNPLIVLAIMGAMGYRRRTSFLTGVTVAQISEFSLVLAALGLTLGHISESAVALITAVGAATITISTYLILHADRMFRWLSPFLRIFERRDTKERQELRKDIRKPVILIGAHRTGAMIAKLLPKKDLLVVDFDPVVVAEFRKEGYDYLAGDCTDAEVFELAHVTEARLVISTSPDFDDNMAFLEMIASQRKKGGEKGEEKKGPFVIVRADTEEEAKLLYAHGTDYVLLPHILSGHYVARVIAGDSSFETLRRMREHDLTLLAKRTPHEVTGKPAVF
jgi:Kef-type K+ transport system membrane component KefB/Trk K+ transport system NAD-binding subunit